MIGIDIVSIARFEKFLEKKTALAKYLSEEEILLVTAPQTAAGFFAAKEAISKALGSGIGATCSFHDIRLYKDDKGAPYFTLSKKLIEHYEIIQTSLSITHDSGFAIAVATIKNDQKPIRQLFH